jgi:hypothetical protein
MKTILNFIEFRPGILESRRDETKTGRTVPSMRPFCLYLAKERMISGAGCLKCDAVTQFSSGTLQRDGCYNVLTVLLQ